LPEPVQSRLATLETDSLAQVALVDRGLGAHWEVRGSDSRLLARLNLDGERAGLVTPEQAERIALRDFVPEDGSGEASVKSTTLIEAEAPSEYREKPLPAYRVELEHVKQPHIYINAQTGQITARRNRSWRAFDFFWMLHTMDYKGRDNFNHWLLTGASLLAIFTALSGIALWGWRVKGRLGRWRRNNRLSARV